MFFSNRPQRSVLKQSGIVKERVFGCDLGEHLLNSGLQVPYVLTSCTEFVETFGVLDGIYRLTGVTSNAQKLRFSFDEGATIDLSQEEYLSDLHSVTAVLKMYFRELPNPLLTYQLYGDFAATLHYKDEERLKRMHEVVRRLPPPNYRTAKRLFGHLLKMAQNSALTNMDTRNLAIVWAPNLMRCKALDNGGANISGMSVLNSVSLQATVTEFMISHSDLIFNDDQAPVMNENTGTNRKPRPTSAILSSPGRLLSLAEAQGRWLQLHSKTASRPVELAAIAVNINPVYHTIIEFPGEKRRVRGGNGKAKDKAVVVSAGSWKTLFSKHAGVIGLKGKHKEKSRAVEDSSAESEEDQQLSEIGHLSRQSQQGSLPSVKRAADEAAAATAAGREGRRVRLLSDHAILSSEQEAPVYTSELNSNDTEPNLVRSASHESFFDGEMASSVCTPGIVFRPAYKVSTVTELVRPAPAPTWRRTTNLSKSPSPVPQSRIPYVPTPDVGSLSDRVQPYKLQRSPSVSRRSVICFSADADGPPDLVAADFPPPCAAAAAAVASEGRSNSRASSLTSSLSRIGSGSEAARAGSCLDQLSPEVDQRGCGSGRWPAAAAEASDAKPSVVGGGAEQQQLRALMSHWDSSDQLLLVATQGHSARTCRLPPPLHSGQPERLSPPVPSPRLQPAAAATATAEAAAADKAAAAAAALSSGLPPALLAEAASEELCGPGPVVGDAGGSGVAAARWRSAPPADAVAAAASGGTLPTTMAASRDVATAAAVGDASQNAIGSSASGGVRWRRKHQQQQHPAPPSAAEDSVGIVRSTDGAADLTAASALAAEAQFCPEPAAAAARDFPAVPSSGRLLAVGGIPSAGVARAGLADQGIGLVTAAELATAAAVADGSCLEPNECRGEGLTCAYATRVALEPAQLAAPCDDIATDDSASQQAVSGNNSNNSSGNSAWSEGPVWDRVILPTSSGLYPASGNDSLPPVHEPLLVAAGAWREATTTAADPASCGALTADALLAAAADASGRAHLLLAPDVPAVRCETSAAARREAALAFLLPPPPPLVVPSSSSSGGLPSCLQAATSVSSDGGQVATGDCSDLPESLSAGGKPPPRPPPRLSLQLPASNGGQESASAGSLKPMRPRRLPPPMPPTPSSAPADDGFNSEAAKAGPTTEQAGGSGGGGGNLLSTAANPGQCAFRWIASPAAMELPSPACAAAAEPIATSVLVRDETGSSSRRSAVAATADECCLPAPAGARQQLPPNAASRDSGGAACGVRTSGLYAAVMLEATKPAAAGLAAAMPSPTASPDITDAFKAFSSA